MILINSGIYSTKQEKQIWFNRAVVAFMLYFLSDECWAAQLSGVVPKVRFFVVFFNMSNYIILCLMSYAWFMFMAASEKMSFVESRKKRWLCLSLSLVFILIMVIAYLVDPYYWVNENNELNDAYYLMMFTAPSMYLTAALIFSMINAKKTDSEEEKTHYRLLALFPFGVMAFGLLQLAGLNAPTFCFGCTIMWLWFYIQNMQTLISIDDLTRLNNRGQINRHMKQVQYKENTPVYVMMIDIDHFKEINDTYGHGEGDRALILVADVLKTVCDGVKSPAFLGRYGGDEFTVILQSLEGKVSPEQMIEEMRSRLQEKQKDPQLPYVLALSVGYDQLRDRNDTMQKCMTRADEKLYEDKRRKA
ncbi:MAG: GGDEF domain-containing protein [Lachnospiraceae bacterium]|nr:GGDEF domain-containing protein [Lachnospiraceae bacterium]